MNKTVLDELNLPKRFHNKLLHDIEYIMEHQMPSLQYIVLFGSCVNGKLKVTSDIDLLLISDLRIDQVTRGEIASALAEPKESVATDVIFYTIQEIQSGTSMFIKQVMKEGIVIWKKD